MTKTPLSSDLDLVKEIEQLRIKQKLLLQAFKEKDGKEEQEKLLSSISSQVQFLVEIFKEENSTDKEAEEETKNNHDKIIEKIDSIKIAIFERMDLLEKKFETLENKTISDKEGIVSEDDADEEKISLKEVEEVFAKKDISEVEKNKNGIDLKEVDQISEITMGDGLPKPDFEVKADLEEPKKKGWFSK